MAMEHIRSKLANNARIIFVGDSYATPETIDGVVTQFILGVPMSDINAYEARMGYISNTRATRFTHSLDGTITEGVNYDIVNAGEGNPYSIDGGDGANEFGLPLDGTTMKFDATLGLGTTGRIGTLNIRQTDATNIPMHKTGSAGNNFNVKGDTGNRFKVRPTFYIRETTENYGNTTDGTHDLVYFDSTTQRLAQNMLTEARGKYWRSETPTTPQACDVLSVNAVATDIEINNAPVAAGQRLMLYDHDLTDKVPNTGENLNLLTTVIYAVDGSDVQIDGTYIQVLSDGSWSFEAFATSAQSTGDKRFTDDQLYDWLDVTTLDLSQEILVITYLAAEGGGVASIKSNMEAIMARFEGWAAAAGAKKPHFLNIAAPVQSGTTTDECRQNSDGIKAASIGKWNADFISLFEMTGGTYFDNNSDDEKNWIKANIPGHASFTFGSVSGANLTSAALLSDTIHPTENGAALFAYLIYRAIYDPSAIRNRVSWGKRRGLIRTISGSR